MRCVRGAYVQRSLTTMISPRGLWLGDPNHQVTRLARQLTDQLQQVPDVEQDTKRKGNSQIKWLNMLLKRTSDNATLLERVESVRCQLPR